MPTNGTVVWQTAGFSLDDGWGINLAGNGARIQIFPGMSADIEFADGYLASAGQIALLPHGETLTYQHCVSAVEQAAGQSGRRARSRRPPAAACACPGAAVTSPPSRSPTLTGPASPPTSRCGSTCKSQSARR